MSVGLPAEDIHLIKVGCVSCRWRLAYQEAGPLATFFCPNPRCPRYGLVTVKWTQLPEAAEDREP